MRFYGRAEELKALREANWRDQAQLIVVYGRRRVGKTALVEQAFSQELVWKFDGLEGLSQKQQLAHFQRQLCLHAGRPHSEAPPTDWEDAFGRLAAAIQGQKDRPLVVFFDEFQWMVGMRSAAVSLFKSCWDNVFAKHRNLRFVLCGSISSFMVKRVIRSRALYGRVSTEIELPPLTLRDAYSFFEGERSREEVIETAMCLGCVPQYLKELNPRLSLVQNLNEYAFSPQGYFFGEYQRIFISHFGRNPSYERVLQILADGPQSTARLASSCRTKTGGTFTSILQDLSLAGFVERYVPLNKGEGSRHVRYRMLDEFLHFHARFIQRHEQEIRTGRYSSLQAFHGNAYAQWQGYAFERLCRRHAVLIADHLRFSGVQYKSGSWFHAPAEGESPERSGAQVDLLFDRADRMLTLCGVKFAQKLEAERLVKSVEAKCAALRQAYPRHGIQKVLILGRAAAIPKKIEGAFDEILRAVDLFF
ncbi:MAG: ATP-binding protein [Planctomycetota bacterium]